MMQDVRRKKEAYRHCGNSSDPVKKYVSSDVSNPQLQAKTPFCVAASLVNLPAQRWIIDSSIPASSAAMNTPHKVPAVYGIG